MSRSTERPPPTKAKGSTLGAASAWSLFEFPNFVDINGAHASLESFSCDSFELGEGSVSGCGADAGRPTQHGSDEETNLSLGEIDIGTEAAEHCRNPPFGCPMQSHFHSQPGRRGCVCFVSVLPWWRLSSFARH